MRERPTKTGKRMAWVTLEDLSGSIELVCFPGKDGKFTANGSPTPLAQARRRDSIDDFLFNTQRGFCEHFASSFTFLMRAAGIASIYFFAS